MNIPRRSFLSSGSLAVLLATAGRHLQPSAAGTTIPRSFPAHDPELAREMVAVSHGNVARVRELLSGRPALAKAVWDRGYGDWETALGAAAHVGNREIAELLLAAGAPPTIFSAAMLGQLTAVQAMIAAHPGLQRVKGPHGISLLAHARAGKASEVINYLESLGDADPRYANEPLSDAERNAIAGTYGFGAAADERIKVFVNDRGALVIQREGAAERNLFHLGSRVFHPPGAEAVRISFAAGERSASLRIQDGPAIVTAARV
jgi:hypothetical protein